MAAENLARKTVAPQLNFKDVFCCVGVNNPLSFRDKTPDKPVMALYGAFITRGVRRRIVQRISAVFLRIERAADSEPLSVVFVLKTASKCSPYSSMSVSKAVITLLADLSGSLTSMNSLVLRSKRVSRLWLLIFKSITHAAIKGPPC